MRKGLARSAILLLTPPVFALAQNQTPPPAQVPQPATQIKLPVPTQRLSLDDAIRLALQHNHALQALRSTILQNHAQEITANLRPNPVLSWDAQFLPIFEPDKFTSDWLDNQAQFDLGISYLFEIGKKRQHRLQAAKDATEQTRWQVTDNERQVAFNVAQQFIAALLAQSTLEFAEQDLKSFQQTVDISEARRKAGDMSEGDLLKIKLQLLQFQTDVASAQVAKVQALAALRQLLGFESVADAFDVAGDLDYEAVRGGVDEFKAMALRSRPDLMAARQGVIAAQSAEKLAEANVYRDLGTTFNYSHISSTNTGAFFFNIQLPIFDRNQGEVARTKYVITQNQELAQEASQQVLTDVVDAYYSLRTNDEIIQLYRGGYVDYAKQSRDISEYAYKRGAVSLLDYLDSERSYRANQLAYRQALANYMIAVEQMRQAVGSRNLP